MPTTRLIVFVIATRRLYSWH